jgi:hypothetical protein
MSARVNEAVHEWPVPTDTHPVHFAPDMSEVTEPVDLFVLVRGESARELWSWEESSALVLRSRKYGVMDDTRDTSWCPRIRIPHAALRDAHACQVHVSWIPDVTESLTVSGKLPDLRVGHTVHLAALPEGFLLNAQVQRTSAWVFGIAYLFGCWMTLRSVKKSRNAKAAP